MPLSTRNDNESYVIDSHLYEIVLLSTFFSEYSFLNAFIPQHDPVRAPLGYFERNSTWPVLKVIFECTCTLGSSSSEVGPRHTHTSEFVY